jgi:hypothetical protein
LTGYFVEQELVKVFIVILILTIESLTTSFYIKLTIFYLSINCCAETIHATPIFDAMICSWTAEVMPKVSILLSFTADLNNYLRDIYDALLYCCL